MGGVLGRFGGLGRDPGLKSEMWGTEQTKCPPQTQIPRRVTARQGICCYDERTKVSWVLPVNFFRLFRLNRRRSFRKARFNVQQLNYLFLGVIFDSPVRKQRMLRG